MFTLAELEAAVQLVRATLAPTPQIAWPLLKARFGAEVVVKHENHTPIGAFKVRGGLAYFERLKRTKPGVRGVVSATRGNHGQSLAFAGSRAGVAVTIVVPRGNSAEKNAAMRAFGAELVEQGRDFDEAKARAETLAAERGLEYAPSFDPVLVAGVATYAYELFGAEPGLDAVYVPIGLGSGICGVIGARDVLGLKTRVFGVVSERANAYRLSFRSGKVEKTESSLTFADGMAVRVPDAAALEHIRRGAEDVIEVSDDEIAEAIRILFTDTHNSAEGAGAAALAGFMKRNAGKRVAVILTGQNIDRPLMQEVLAGRTPRVA